MKKNVRSGFTLPEVLVTVTVVAVLAAVVVPAVTQFAAKGDSPSTKSDLNALTSSITGFTADIRKFPGDLRQLSTIISTTATNFNSDALNPSATYSNADVGKWKGPYSSETLNPSGAFTTAGYGLEVGPTLSVTSGWLRAPINKISGQDVDCVGLMQIDLAIDGKPTATGNEYNTGLVQWTNSACTTGSTATPGPAFLRLVPAS